MRQKFVMGNWKMNGRLTQVERLLSDLIALYPATSKATCVVFPPAIYIPYVASQLQQTSIFYGAQNIYPAEKGAYTGEIAGPMLTDFGCRYVLVGHSERRHLFHENEKIIAEKFHHVKEHGMIPVLCVGETQEERDQGLTERVLHQQLSTVQEHGFDNSIIAYEPVWAIGTGRTAAPEEVQAMHVIIRRFVASKNAQIADKLSILYGGSVNEKNASSLFAMPDVDGGLIGGASLQAQSFVEILRCIN
jgi:triosephosphate isomerase